MKASRFILFAILASLITFSSYAGPDENPGSPAEWTYMGKVFGVTKIKLNNKLDDVTRDGSFGLLYSNFDGENMVYKLYVPADGKTYTAHRVGDGKRSVNYRRGGIDVPGLSEMYTHCAGSYYFNTTDARK